MRQDPRLTSGALTNDDSDDAADVIANGPKASALEGPAARLNTVVACGQFRTVLGEKGIPKYESC